MSLRSVRFLCCVLFAATFIVDAVVADPLRSESSPVPNLVESLEPQSAARQPLPINDPTLAQLLHWHDQLIAAREQILSCRGMIVFGRPTANRVDGNQVVDLLSRLKQPEELQFAIEGANLRNQHVQYIRILTPTQILSRSTPRSATYHEKVLIRRADDIGGLMRPADLRILGMIPDPINTLCSQSITQWYGRDQIALADITAVDVQRIERGGRSLVYLRSVYANGDSRELWIDPERGPNVVSHICTSVVDDGGQRKRYLQSLNVELQEYDGVWFPFSVELSTQLDDQVVGSELQVVTNLVINTDIDDALFTLASMELPPGGLVNDFSDAQQFQAKMWTGKEAEPVYQALREAEKKLPPPAGRERLWLLLTINLIVLAVILTAIVVRRRRTGR